MTDYVVLVTVASGDIGRGVVRKILDQTDYKVVITVTPGNKEKYNFGARVEEIVMDASDISSVNIAIKRICMNQISHFIQLHGNSNTDDRLDVQNYERLIYNHNINIFSTIMIVQALLNGMKERKFGRICLMSTASSEHGGGPETFGYGMAKHSAGYLIKHLAKYYTSFNILSNCISPGFIDTKFHKSVLKRSSRQIQERIKNVKLKRAGSVEEVADLAFFLTFSNNFISGQNVKIDGGDFI